MTMSSRIEGNAMNKDQMKKIIDEMIEEVGISNPASIAFAIMQHAAEEARGTDLDEANALQGMIAQVNDAAEEEIMILRGGEGRVYMTP